MPIKREITIRAFEPADAAACIAIFESNVPDFVAPSERSEFQQFLGANESPYLVAVDDRKAIVACGGYYFDLPERVAGLTWGMVHRSRHRCGIGTAMLRHRLDLIRVAAVARAIRVNTSQRAKGFFERQGFSVVSVVPDGYAAGIDRVEMVLEQ